MQIFGYRDPSKNSIPAFKMPENVFAIWRKWRDDVFIKEEAAALCGCSVRALYEASHDRTLLAPPFESSQYLIQIVAQLVLFVNDPTRRLSAGDDDDALGL